MEQEDGHDPEGVHGVRGREGEDHRGVSLPCQVVGGRVLAGGGWANSICGIGW